MSDTQAPSNAMIKEGPHVERSCRGCHWHKSERYQVQGDSGYDHYCTHGGAKRDTGSFTGKTPDWCPFTQSAHEPPAAPVAYRKFIDSAYERHPRYTFREDTGIGAPEGWEALYTRPAPPPVPGQWISVDERLPELSRFNPESCGPIMATEHRVFVATAEGRVFETIRASLGFANLNSRTDCVTHWMPLPSHPTKGENHG